MSARIRIHDDGWRLHLKWWADDSVVWHHILHDFKSTFATHGERSYSSATRTWSVPLWCRRRLEEWCAYWFDSSSQQWDEDGAAGYTDGRTYDSHGGYSQYRRPETSTSTLEQAYRVLHLYPTAPPELVRAAHRVMVKLSHPDSGGSHEAAVAVNAAWEQIQAHQNAERRAS